MRNPQHLSVLASSPLVEGLDETAKTELLAAAVEKRVPRGRLLFRQGDPAEVMYVVLEGTFKLTQEDHHGHEALVRFLKPGAVMAAVALVPGHGYPVTARAMEPAAVALWHQGELVRLCRRYPALHFQVTAQIAAHMREMQERFLELASERVEQRLARCLVRLALQVGKKTAQGVLLDVPITRQDLAAMTGTTLYTVSRILSHWREMGLLHGGRRLLIRSLQGLASFAEDLPEGGKL